MPASVLEQRNSLGIAKGHRRSDSPVMDGIRGKQLLVASEIFLSLAVGGLLAVNHRLQECPIFAAAMYLLMTLGYLLLVLFLCRWKKGSATASATDFGYEPAKTFITLGKLLLCENVRGKQLLVASEIFLSLAVGGLLAVNHRLQECPIFAAAMYLLMTLGYLLLGLFLCRWKQGSTTASATDFGYEPAKTFITLGKLLLCVATGGMLVVPTKPMDQFPNFAAAMILLYLLMTVGILLLWRSVVLSDDS